ncbi:16S rRNA (guanine(966)-N(2))-methyltransferase RsmD [Thermolongibacillus altinsuensis]|jgi:16S rRNA (guanine966-N2)-methyltransferase|uniref:16S rRNA (guanine(966)-N(2))-methyltransferase RsmD n=1 Tax=Thermolongibacillus altinsuensis TaxID=575256 RepID=UPI00104B4860|nr:16S rRNA (guanine(966)-N(2))-methyltransferase RsmD [Thermolongibacillus altinsuensis]GMB08572.1 methyltransferase [Thermolongibacillus altinsuensis]
MRVISGKCKGKKLQAVPGMSTRPTTDKVKEAIFNIIGPYFSEGVGLDLFGGSGGLGIEALSRGLDKVIFVDHDPKAVQTIRKNVEACRLTEQAEVYRNDAERALKAIIKRGLTFRLIFLDPPYKSTKLASIIAMIDDYQLLRHDGYIVAEHSEETILPEQIGRLQKIKSETYGITTVSIYGYVDDEKGE